MNLATIDLAIQYILSRPCQELYALLWRMGIMEVE